MRWLYYNASDPDEATARASIERKIADWWHQFACKVNDLDDLFSQRSEWDLPDWMEQLLQAISPDLMWEFGQSVRGDGHRLVITPEAERHLRPMVQTLLERAPSLPGWEFYAYRLPEDLAMARQMVTVRAGGELSGTLATAMIGQHNRINLSLNEILVPAQVGCVIGGGTGLRYSYIDLAPADVDAALPLIKPRLRAGNINQRTWLLFFDAPLAHEWVGVYDDSPAPP